jgi:outer membrane receptor for monomeric catechols
VVCAHIRYGAGVSYKWLENCAMTVSPVAELVGWTVLSGKVAVTESPGSVTIEDAAGDTIINAKVGLRFDLRSNGQFYLGYGRALTGDQWYDDVFRFEYRLFF